MSAPGLDAVAKASTAGTRPQRSQEANVKGLKPAAFD